MREMLAHVQFDETICSIWVALYMAYNLYIVSFLSLLRDALPLDRHITARLSMPGHALPCHAAGRAMRQALQVVGLACRAPCNQAARVRKRCEIVLNRWAFPHVRLSDF